MQLQSLLALPVHAAVLPVGGHFSARHLRAASTVYGIVCQCFFNSFIIRCPVQPASLWFVTVYGVLRTTLLHYRDGNHVPVQPEPVALAQVSLSHPSLQLPTHISTSFPPYLLCLWLTPQKYISSNPIHRCLARLLHTLSHHVVRHPPLSLAAIVPFIAAVHSPAHHYTLSTSYTNYPHASPSSCHGACQEY